jgi:CubicO group peptidase (beta-lactamase class C family)
MLGLALGGAPDIARAELSHEPEGSATERAAMASAANGFMSCYAVPGLSVAIARSGRLVYVEAFGQADRADGETLTPAHRFRIASVSKPVTSVAIFTLIETGGLRLGDLVFGPGGVLGVDYGAPPYAPYIDRVTVEHLLTHTGGGWRNDNRDPMFLNPRMTHAELIAWTLRTMPLETAPGTAFAYSNFGYCLLGRVIEKLTGQRYEAFVRDTILRRCGIEDMRVGGDTLAERLPREVRYHGQNDEDPYGMNVRRMDSHGGWVGSPTDLVRFATHFDGFRTTPNLLSPETLQTMITPSAANGRYAKGWAVNSYGNWWHTGSLPGTATIIVRTHGDFCWAVFTNTRRPRSAMDGDLDRLIWTMVREVRDWSA